MAPNPPAGRIRARRLTWDVSTGMVAIRRLSRYLAAQLSTALLNGSVMPPFGA